MDAVLTLTPDEWHELTKFVVVLLIFFCAGWAISNLK
jgi:hypothetical protein